MSKVYETIKRLQAERASKEAKGTKKEEKENESDLSGLTPPERLSVARDRLIKAELDWEKYFSIGGQLRDPSAKREGKADEKRRATLESYEKARAEMVDGNIRAFMEEETKLADQRIQAATEKKGSWEKVSQLYKLMGEVKLLPSGWRASLENQGYLGKIAARGVNVRTAVGFGLLGVGFLAPPMALLTLGARRAMTGIGATMFISEWLERRVEVLRTTIDEKEIEKLDINGVASKLAEYTIGLRMQGKLASESDDYKKLLGRLESLFNDIYEKAELATQNVGTLEKETVSDSLLMLSSRLSFEYSQEQRAFKLEQSEKRLISILAGCGAALGASSVLKYLYGTHVAAVGELTGIDEIQLRPESVPETPVIPGAGATSETARLEEIMLEKEKTPAVPEEITQPSAGQWPSAELGPSSTPPNEAVEQALQEQQAGEASFELLPDSFDQVVQSGEGPIHEARKAIAEYIARSYDDKLRGLSKAQRVLAEEKLYRAMKDSLPEWKVGAKVSFPRDTISSVLDEVKNQTETQAAVLDKNLSPFVDRVNWDRYNVTGYEEATQSEWRIHKPWEYDEGIKYVKKAAQEAAESGGAETIHAPAAEILQNYETEMCLPPELSDTPMELAVDPGEAALLTDELKLKAEAIKEVDPSLAQELMFASKDAAAKAVTDSAIEKAVWFLTGLDPEEYGAVKNLKISEAVRKTYWGVNEETRWPSFREPNRLDLWRKVKLRERIMEVLKNMTEGNRNKAVKLTIHQFIKEHMLRRA